MGAEGQDVQSKPRAGFLNEITSHNDFLQTVHPPNIEELQHFRYVLGDNFTLELAQLHAPLYVFNGESNLGTIHIDDKDRGFLTHLPFHKYLRTNYATILDGWLVFIDTWQAKTPEKSNQNKAARFDFVLLDDWMNNDVTSDEANTRKIKPDAHAKGLFTRGYGLLKNLKHLITSIPTECRIDIHSADAEREHIYRKAFANRPNIILHMNDDDKSNPLKYINRKLSKKDMI